MSGLRELVTPQSLKEIEKEAFAGCESLKYAILNEGLRTLGWSAFKSSALESVTLPPTLKRVETDAFFECRRLRYVILSEGIERLGMACF